MSLDVGGPLVLDLAGTAAVLNPPPVQSSAVARSPAASSQQTPALVRRLGSRVQNVGRGSKDVLGCQFSAIRI